MKADFWVLKILCNVCTQAEGVGHTWENILETCPPLSESIGIERNPARVSVGVWFLRIHAQLAHAQLAQGASPPLIFCFYLFSPWLSPLLITLFVHLFPQGRYTVRLLARIICVTQAYNFNFNWIRDMPFEWFWLNKGQTHIQLPQRAKQPRTDYAYQQWTYSIAYTAIILTKDG